MTEQPPLKVRRILHRNTDVEVGSLQMPTNDTTRSRYRTAGAVFQQTKNITRNQTPGRDPQSHRGQSHPVQAVLLSATSRQASSRLSRKWMVQTPPGMDSYTISPCSHPMYPGIQRLSPRDLKRCETIIYISNFPVPSLRPGPRAHYHQT